MTCRVPVEVVADGRGVALAVGSPGAGQDEFQQEEWWLGGGDRGAPERRQVHADEPDLGRREAIVEERPGVTRDRKEVEASWQGRPFMLVDTGGWMAGGDSLDEKVSRQSEKAIADADAVLFVVDATVGVTEDDARVATLLRSRHGTVIVVANKVDDRVHEAASWELMSRWASATRHR